MPAPASIDEFIEIIGKSGVAESSKIKSYVQKLAAEGHSVSKPDKLGEAMVRDGVLTFFQAEQLLQGKWKRFFIGKYKVLERIGTGGMGQVFLCEHKLMKRRVALKVLPAAKAQDPASLERFYREARAVAALDHPNIVRAYDIDQDENIHFLVMEFVDGPNLQDLVKKIGPMDPLRASHYVYGAAVGMQHAHEMGIVHRDIKPGNVLVDRAGIVKVLDMGLARFFHDEDDLLTKKYDENVLGTADYLAPEQAVDSHSVDIRADIYSLGGTFYYMLTGQSPFPDGTIAQKLLWHQTRDPKPIRSLRPEVPQSLVAVIETMLKKKVTDRYQTPGDLMQALAPFVQQPIAPPQEYELPSISAAASAANFQAPRASNAAIKSSVMGSLPSSSGFGGPSSNFNFGGSTATVTLPPPASGGGGWANIASDTQPKGLNDTARNPKPNPAVAPIELINGKPNSRMGLGVLLGVVVTAALAVFAFWLTNKKSFTPVADGGRVKLYVTKSDHSPDSARTYPTLKAAMAAAMPGSTIVLLDERIEEPAIATVNGKPKEGLADCTIESGTPSKMTTWLISPSASPSGSALEFQNLVGLTVSGLTIECKEHCKFGVSILGLCPGLTLDRVSVRNATIAGVRIDNGAGDSARPIKFDHVTVSGKNLAQPMMAGMLITASPTLPNKFIHIANSRFDGPGGDAVRVAGPLSDVEITGNRFAYWQNGVTFSSGMPAEGLCKVAVVSNSFFQIENGIRCDVPMPKSMRNDIAVKQNLFARCQSVATGPAGAITGLTASENARDAESKEGKGLSIPTEMIAEQLLIDPSNDETFLRTTKSSAFGSVGAKKVQVGAPGN